KIRLAITFIMEHPFRRHVVSVCLRVFDQCCCLAGYRAAFLLTIRGDPRINGGWFVHPLSPYPIPAIQWFLCFRPLATVFPGPATDRLAPVSRVPSDQIDSANEGSVADLISAHPRPRPRGSSMSNARLTTSLMDKPLAVAYARTR